MRASITAEKKKDMMKAMGMGTFMWICDDTYPKSDINAWKPGKNMAGFKGKATLLWPYNNRGKPDPQKKYSRNASCLPLLSKALKTTPIDSFQFNDEDVAEHIVASFGA